MRCKRKELDCDGLWGSLTEILGAIEDLLGSGR